MSRAETSSSAPSLRRLDLGGSALERLAPCGSTLRRLTVVAAIFAATLGATGVVVAAPAVDGVIDAEYGAPLATDPKGDYVAKPQWDLHRLYVTHDATFLYVAFTIAGDLGANPSEEKNYLFYIDTTNDNAGATSDAWQRNIKSTAPHLPEYSINTWYKSGTYGTGNVERRSWTGSAWSSVSAAISAAALKSSASETVIEWRIARADLGNPSTIWVEAISTGSFQKDNAQDTINTPADDWNAPAGAQQWLAAATVKTSTRYVLVPPADAGVPDVGVPDVGVPDVGTPDVGLPDVGVPDVGVPDIAKLDASKPLPDASKPLPDASKPGDLSAGDATKHDSTVDAAQKVDATRQRDSGKPPADGSPWPDGSVPAGDATSPLPDEEGCGCAAKGDLRAANALPLVLAFLVIGLRRRYD